MPVLELLPLLHVAALALKVAREQIPALQAHKERCTLLINRSERLLEEVSAQCQSDRFSLIQPKINILESACISVRETVTELAGKGLAWRLLHQEQMEKAIIACEAKLADAFSAFHVGAHFSIGEIQADIAEASRRDHQQFILYLEGISQNDNRIIEALRASNLRLEETLMALMKHIQSRPAAANESDQPSERFIRRAVNALQKVSTGALRSDVAPWQITSLEVEYERREETCLGVGGFGKVFRGHWHGEVVAVKEMHEGLLTDVRTDRHFKSFEKEIKIWLRLNHPRILPFYGACLEAEKPFLVTRYCPNGNIMDFIREHPEINRIAMLHQVSVGMMYLHSQSIIHADLKAANILVGDDCKALLCDFGLSQLKDQVKSSQSNSRVIQGTLNYMSPEYLEGDPIDYPADVYSFAMTAWQVHTGLVPFNDVPRRSFYRWVIDKRNRPVYPNSMNKSLWTLLEDCWHHDPSQRPAFASVEATLKSLITTTRRASLASTNMLMFPPEPSPPRSYVTSGSNLEVPSISPASQVIVPDVQPLENEWLSVPSTPISYPVSRNSIDVFTRTLRILHETISLDKLVETTLLCYPNWLKVKNITCSLLHYFDSVFLVLRYLNSSPIRASIPEPANDLTIFSRVKNNVKEFKRNLLLWIDNIPSLRGADILNGYRTLLFIVGTCAMGEHTFRQNPDAPHLYVHNFMNNIMATNPFRATVETSVKSAWDHYNLRLDAVTLADRLVQLVNHVSS